MNFFKNMPLKLKLTTGFAIPIILIVGLSTLIYKSTHSLVDSAKWVNHTHEAVAIGSTLGSAMIDMAMGRKTSSGYLLTPQPKDAIIQHHSGNIGILGVDKKGTELYQITLGGNPKDDASVGSIIGPGFRAEAVPDVIDTIVNTYLENRDEGESFLDTWRRVGAPPFKEALYGAR